MRSLISTLDRQDRTDGSRRGLLPKLRAVFTAVSAAPSHVRDLLLILVVATLYGDVVSYGYIWDDHLLVELSFADVVESLSGSVHLRPVWYLSYPISGAIVEGAYFDHAINLLMFMLAVLLARRVAELFLSRSWTAFLVTLTWVFLPWNVYPVTWIAQRNDLLIFVFGFSALIALHRGRYVTSFFLLTLGVFSKPTIAFVPALFLWKTKTKNQNLLAIAFLFLMTVYWSFALRNYLSHFTPGDHLAALPAGLKMLTLPLHWVEHFLTLVLPMPFFLGIFHVGLYLIGMIGLFAAGLRRDRVARCAEDSRGREVLALALLTSIPTVITPELRICGLESLFWLILIARHLRFRRRIVAAGLYLALMASYAMGLATTKAIFDTTVDLPGTESPRALYPNGFYGARRHFLRGLAQRWNLTVSRTAPPLAGRLVSQPPRRFPEHG